MDVRHMRQVLAIHRHGSFVKAAEEVGVAQPTLSKSIARLEDELGLKLFDRTGSGARVTPMGALLVERAETIIAEAERLARDIELIAAGQIGEARIGLGPALRRVFLPQFAEALASQHRSLRLQLSVDARERLIADLQAGSLDLVIIGWGPELDGQDYVQTEIMRDRAVVAASPTHPLAQLERVSIEAFLRYPTAGSAQLSLLSSPRARGVPGSPVQQETLVQCNDEATLKMLATKGLATLIGNQHVVQPELDSGELVRLPLDWTLPISIVAITTRAASHSPILREVVQLAERIGRDLERGA